MLRVKKDYDLNNLVTDFGFENTIDNTFVKDVIITAATANSDDYECCIVVNPLKSSRCENEIVFNFNNTEDIEVEADSIDAITEIDVLFDMITAGIVEKI